ncbi:MAG: hypothetical protein ACK58L_13045 [Planctomycetota bacterium]
MLKRIAITGACLISVVSCLADLTQRTPDFPAPRHSSQTHSGLRSMTSTPMRHRVALGDVSFSGAKPYRITELEGLDLNWTDEVVFLFRITELPDAAEFISVFGECQRKYRNTLQVISDHEVHMAVSENEDLIELTVPVPAYSGVFEWQIVAVAHGSDGSSNGPVTLATGPLRLTRAVHQ